MWLRTQGNIINTDYLGARDTWCAFLSLALLIFQCVVLVFFSYFGKRILNRVSDYSPARIFFYVADSIIYPGNTGSSYEYQHEMTAQVCLSNTLKANTS